MSDKIMKWAFDMQLPWVTKFILVTLAIKADENGFCLLSIKNLTEILRLTRRTVRKCLQLLIQHNIISELGNDTGFKLNLEIKDINLLPAKKKDNRLMGFKWQSIRKKVLLRDNHKCFYCGSVENLVCDHITPLCKGGTNDLTNLVAACHSCNNSKGKKTLEEWKNKPKNEGLHVD